MALITAAVLSACESQTSPGFEESRWGADPEQVLTVEPPAQSAVGAYAVQGARPLDLEPMPIIATTNSPADAGSAVPVKARTGVPL